MPPKPAVLTSPFRKEIEGMILEGKSSRNISNWLKEQGENIGYGAINSYRNNHFNPKKNAKQRYQEKKSTERLDKAVDKIVSDLEYCDDIVQLASKINLKVDHDNKITEMDIKKLGLTAIRTKNEILKAGEEQDKEFTIRIISVDTDETD